MSLMKEETHLDLKTYIFHYLHLSSRIIFTLLYVVSQISLNLFIFPGFSYSNLLSNGRLFSSVAGRIQSCSPRFSHLDVLVL